MSDIGTDTISVKCVCGKKLKAPASAAGRKARCPKCGNVMTLEAPQLEEVFDPAYELGEQEQSGIGASVRMTMRSAIR